MRDSKGLLMLTNNIHVILMGMILIVGFILRSYGNNFGFPLLTHTDEFVVIGPAIKLVETNYAWWYPPVYGMLATYIDAIFFKFAILLDNLGLMQVNRSTLYLISRYLSAVFGTLTIILIYYIGKIVYNKQIGLMAALFLAVIPGAIRYSHYGTTDIELTFFMTLAFLFSFLIIKDGGIKYYIYSGIAVGLAASTKQTGLFSIAMLYLANTLQVLGTKSDQYLIDKIKSFFWNRSLIISVCLAGIIYLTINVHYIIKNGFLNQFLAYRVATTPTSAIMSPLDIPLWYIMDLRTNITWNLEVLSLTAVIFALTHNTVSGLFDKKLRSKFLDIQSDIFVIAWIVIYFSIISSWKVSGDRYLMPLLPFLMLVLSNLLFNAIEFIGHTLGYFHIGSKGINIIKYLTLIIICSYLIIAPLQSSIIIDKDLAKEDTRQIAFNWIKGNIPEHSIIVREHGSFTPEAELIDNISCRVVYGMFRMDFEKFVKDKVNYLIIPDSVYGDYYIKNFYSNKKEHIKEIQFYESIKQRCELLKVVENNEGINSNIYLGSTIKIYRIKEVPLPINSTTALYWTDPVSMRRFK